MHSSALNPRVSLVVAIAIRSSGSSAHTRTFPAPSCVTIIDPSGLNLTLSTTRSPVCSTRLWAPVSGSHRRTVPSAWAVGQETLVFVGAMAVANPALQQLTAVRMGEIHPPMLARHIATLDHILKGRLTVNIISSELPGERIDAGARYRRSEEVLQILQQCWTQDHLDFEGEFYTIKLPSTAPVRPLPPPQ